MTPVEIAALAMDLPEVTEEQPFGPDVDVYKVAGKIFAILSPDGPTPSVSLKCDPELAIALREEYTAITAGYHLNKKHWNTVRLDGSVPPDEVADQVNHSFDRVVATLSQRDRERIARQSGR